MADMKQIYDFAVKWYDIFRDQNTNSLEVTDHFIADECKTLGFKMDCGQSFESFYGNAFYNCVELKKVIDDITDISLLGSAIYSRWRYFNHWAYSSEEILELENRKWFIIALSRLALLSEDDSFHHRR